MPFFDLPLDELRDYRPVVRRPDDFDEFWASTLEEARSFPLNATAEPVENNVTLIDSYDVTFAGFGGHPIKGWMHVPAGANGPLPTVIQYHGYTGGRGMAWENHLYAEAGYAHLTLDTRGQGSRAVGATPDPTADAGASTVPGLMTKGIMEPATYYYRRVYTDAVRAVDAARSLDLVDADRVVVTGRSQGGGMAIAAAGLAAGLLGAMPDVPFLCQFERAVGKTDQEPYSELVTYLARYRDRVDRVFDTLSYFDGVNLAARATAPGFFSVALMDEICPPSTVFAAYNAWGHEESAIEVYPYNQHEGGEEHHQLKQLEWLRSVFA